MQGNDVIAKWEYNVILCLCERARVKRTICYPQIHSTTNLFMHMFMHDAAQKQERTKIV